GEAVSAVMDFESRTKAAVPISVCRLSDWRFARRMDEARCPPCFRKCWARSTMTLTRQSPGPKKQGPPTMPLWHPWYYATHIKAIRSAAASSNARLTRSVISSIFFWRGELTGSRWWVDCRKQLLPGCRPTCAAVSSGLTPMRWPARCWLPEGGLSCPRGKPTANRFQSFAFDDAWNGSGAWKLKKSTPALPILTDGRWPQRWKQYGRANLLRLRLSVMRFRPSPRPQNC